MKRRVGRPSAGDVSRDERVLRALANGPKTPPEVEQETGLLRLTPHFTRLEKNGLIRKLEPVTFKGIGTNGRPFNQGGFRWVRCDWKDGEEPSATDQPSNTVVSIVSRAARSRKRSPESTGS